jgi:hypothetical protein
MKLEMQATASDANVLQANPASFGALTCRAIPAARLGTNLYVWLHVFGSTPQHSQLNKL